MINLITDKKRKSYSVKDILNNNIKSEEENVNPKTLDLNNEKDLYAWAEYWKKHLKENK